MAFRLSIRRTSRLPARARVPTRPALVIAATLALSTASLRAGAQGAPGAPPASPLPDTGAIPAAMIEAGRAAFHGAGQCTLCHGANLEGGVGPTLRAHAWKDAERGELAAIYRVITHGVPGTAMVSHPGGISDKTAARIAAYIWAVANGKAKP